MNFPLAATILFLASQAESATIEDRDGGLPAFSETDCDPEYDLCLKVDYADGAEDVIELLEMPDFPEILNGYLQIENNVMVTVILGEDDEEGLMSVHFASEHAECHRFNVDTTNNFEVECITGWHLLGTNDEVDGEQDRIERQSNQRSSLDRTISPRALDANGYVLKVGVFYDDPFQKQHTSKSEKKVREVMAVVNNMYSEKATLTTTIDIQVVGIKHAAGQDWSGDFYAALDIIGPMAVNSELDANLYIGMTGTNGGGLLGLAPMASVCNQGRSRRINMNQFAGGSIKNAVDYTAETVAHEMGHNLGMDHDFSGSPGNMKTFNGKTCTGYMDYQDNTQGWSGCSARDFENYLDGLSTVCLSSGNGGGETTTAGGNGGGEATTASGNGGGEATTVSPGESTTAGGNGGGEATTTSGNGGGEATTVGPGGDCADEFPGACPDWAMEGDCNNDWKDWMAENCKSSCNLCDGGNCSDKKSKNFCKKKKKQSKCGKNWIKKQCRKTCALC